jgi:hypothetical protein
VELYLHFANTSSWRGAYLSKIYSIAWNLVKHRDFIFTFNIMSRDRSVCIATGYELDDQMIGVRFSVKAGNFSLRHCVQTGSGAHPVSYPVSTGGSFPGVKRSGCEAGHSSPSTAEVKECVELYLRSSIRLHGVVLS